MPSLLHDYPGSATRKNEKILRAINSVIGQTFEDWELIIGADGCELTEWIIKKHITDSRVKCIMVQHKGCWSNSARNAALDQAKGEYILYLDIDDCYDKDHLKIINEQLNGEDWVWSNYWTHYTGKWTEQQSDMEQYAMCGTPNPIHASRLGLRWGVAGYGHDYHFIQQLLTFPNNRQIKTAQYMMCHIPNSYEI